MEIATQHLINGQEIDAWFPIRKAQKVKITSLVVPACTPPVACIQFACHLSFSSINQWLTLLPHRWYPRHLNHHHARQDKCGVGRGDDVLEIRHPGLLQL